MLSTQTEVPLNLNSFVISKDQQYLIQQYIQTGVQSPGTKEAMKLALESFLRQAGSSVSVSDDELMSFSQLIGNYKAVKEHCSDFKTNIYPKSVQMADNLAYYGSNAHVYYQAILQIAYEWLDGEKPATAVRAEIAEIAGFLKTIAESYARQIGEVKGDFVGFLLNTQTDQGQLKGTETEYVQRFSLNESEIKELESQLNSIKTRIQTLEEEYRKAVTIAATTPAYLAASPWLAVYICIPIAIVAGIYGKQATDLLTQIEGEQQKLAAQTDSLQKKMALRQILSAGNDGLSFLLKALEAALPVLDTIKGLWEALASQSAEIPQVIETNVLNGSLAEIDTAYTDLIDRWKVLSIAAGQYRDTAYIKIEYVDPEKIKKNPQDYMDIDPSKINWNEIPKQSSGSLHLA